MNTANEIQASLHQQRLLRRRRLERRRQIRRRRIVAVAVMVSVGMGLSGAALAATGATGGVSPAAAPPRPSAPQTVSVICPAPSLGGSLPARVYLPAGYRNSGTRYPVIYFLHGLPANPTSYEYNGFVAQAVAGAHRSAIVVTPQGARAPNSDREYLDWDPTEDWPAAISHDLVGCIDHRYRTIADRHGRVLAGLSAGGYGAFNIGLRSLSTFGALESWSGYFAATNPAGTAVLDLGSARANAAAAIPTGPELKAELARYPTYIGFYVGDQDTRFLQDNRSLDASLRTEDVTHTFDVYPGGHSGSLWRGEAPSWLANALASLAQ